MVRPPGLLAWREESMREEGELAERALLILVIWERAAVAGPTVMDASSSIMVSICSQIAYSLRYCIQI